MIKRNKYEVIKDDREQRGWDFPESDECLGTTTERLPTGDYSIRGMEKVFVIERKLDLSEFSKNILEERFDRELERLEEFDYPFLIATFTYDNIKTFPINSGIPKYLWPKVKIKPNFILSKICSYQVKYKTRFILAGEMGESVAQMLFRKMAKLLGSDNE